MQQTPVWCWLAVGEMVFEHYGVPNINPAGIYQCGVIGGIAGPASPCWRDCRLCIVPAGSMAAIQNMLRTYPLVARQLSGDTSITPIASEAKSRQLFENEIKEEIDNDRPIIAGINPTGFAFPGVSQHVALIVGYEENDGDLVLTINDPFPFDLGSFSGLRNPYIAAGGQSFGDGSYEIEYGDFRRNLRWNTSIYRIREP